MGVGVCAIPGSIDPLSVHGGIGIGGLAAATVMLMNFVKRYRVVVMAVRAKEGGGDSACVVVVVQADFLLEAPSRFST